MSSDTLEHLRGDVGKAEGPRAGALLGTAAEVLGGLVKAYEFYERGFEEARCG